MKQIDGANGLYEVEDQMPCNPSQIGLGLYFLPNTLGRAEREEAAARILMFSHQMNRWVGVKWSRMAEVMQEDLEKHDAQLKTHNRNVEARWAYATAKRRYMRNAILTLGLSLMFTKKPVLELEEESNEKLPFTIMSVFGPQSVINGVHELIEDGMLTKKDVGEGDDAFSVFFPTPKLVSRIMEVQKVAIQPA